MGLVSSPGGVKDSHPLNTAKNPEIRAGFMGHLTRKRFSKYISRYFRLSPQAVKVLLLIPITISTYHIPELLLIPINITTD